MRFSCAGTTSAALIVASLLQTCAAAPQPVVDGVEESLTPEHHEHMHMHEKRGNVYLSSTYPAGAASKTAIVTPTVKACSVLGPATHSAVSSYLALPSAALPQLSQNDRTTSKINSDLQNNYPIWNGSGTVISSAPANLKKKLSTSPSYSRDSGRGGTINGVTIFVFADTNSYTTPTGPNGGGSYTGSSSNSYAVDQGMLAAQGQPPLITERFGSYVNSKGAARGFVPFTTGEAAYNQENGATSRWAIWPASSFIAGGPSTAYQYAPIIWANNTGGGDGGSYTGAGVTLCEIYMTSNGNGPACKRIAPRIFPAGTEWGVIGGIRSFGPSGTSGGMVYVFGKTSSGLMIARVPVGSITELSAYRYYYPSSGSWAATVPSASSIHNFYSGSFSAVDIFYSPRHLTFIMVYMNGYVDNTLYWRYLVASKPILPTYAGGDDADIAALLVKYKWSSQQTLLQLPAPRVSFSYDGGATLGYFGEDDISRGGTKMLLSWTDPNGYAANGQNAGYWLNTAVATFA